MPGLLSVNRSQNFRRLTIFAHMNGSGNGRVTVYICDKCLCAITFSDTFTLHTSDSCYIHNEMHPCVCVCAGVLLFQTECLCVCESVTRAMTECMLVPRAKETQ